MDTLNDGSPLTMKTVLPLQEVHETGPWTWHGWQTDLDASLQKSFTETMQGSPASTEDVAALSAYFKQLKLPKNPYTNPKPEADPEFFAAVERGAKLFASERAACSQCHTGDQFTDGEIHDVGLGSPSDRYEGYNTPSLRGAIRKVRFLHDGRAKTLESVLTDYHTFEKFNAGEKLSSDDVRDLIAYLKTL